MIDIRPDQLYEEEHLRTVWGFTSEALAEGRRKEGLRYRKVGRRRLYLGEWLLEWLKKPEATHGN